MATWKVRFEATVHAETPAEAALLAWKELVDSEAGPAASVKTVQESSWMLARSVDLAAEMTAIDGPTYEVPV